LRVCRELQIIHTDFKPENVMLFDTLSPRHWEMQLNPVSGPPPPAAAAAGRAAGSSGQAPSGSASLTKNQKKKAKKKAKKAAAGGSAEVSADSHAVLVGGGGETKRLSFKHACSGIWGSQLLTVMPLVMPAVGAARTLCMYAVT
jgi:hypothetical protein